MAVGLLTSASAPTDLNKKSYATMITRLMPNGTAPLFGLTALLKDETAANIEHGYYTKSMQFTSAFCAAGASDSVTAIPCTLAADIVPGDMLLVDGTNEVMLVTAGLSGGNITVRRGIGTVAAATIPANTTLRHIGNAFEEGSVRPTAVSIVAERYVNFTQIFRNSWAVTKTAAAIPQIAGTGAVSESKEECAAFHALALEKSLFFGQKFMGTHNNQPFHTMEGILPRIQAAAPGNITTLGATTNWTQFEAALDPTLQTVTDPKGGNIRTMFVGGVARRVIHNIARLNASYQITTAETAWGLQIDTIKAPRGTFEIVEHPLFNAFGNTSAWAKMAIICDLNAFSLAYLRKTANEEYNGQGQQVDNGVDAQGGTLTTEVTCTIKNPSAFGVIYNFTAAAAG